MHATVHEQHMNGKKQVHYKRVILILFLDLHSLIVFSKTLLTAHLIKH